MKIAVIGIGAMGSIYAGLLADAENEVWVYDIWQDHLDHIRQADLRVEGASGDRVVKNLSIIEPIKAQRLQGCDLFVIATKTSGVGDAAQRIFPHVTECSVVLTIQNGLGAGDRLAEFMDTRNVLLGFADGFGASIKGPGHIHHNAINLIKIGEMSGGESERLNRIVAVWQKAGFNVRAFADINQLIWEKFLCNVTFSAPCAVFNCTLRELIETPAYWSLALGCTQEAYDIGKALGISFSFDDPIAYVTAFGRKIPDARPSMLLDHLSGRPSEIDAINGRVPVLGAKLGISTPYNETLSAIIRHRELNEKEWGGTR